MSSKYASKSSSTINVRTTEYYYNIDALLNALDINGRPTSIQFNVTYEKDKPCGVMVVTKE